MDLGDEDGIGGVEAVGDLEVFEGTLMDTHVFVDQSESLMGGNAVGSGFQELAEGHCGLVVVTHAHEAEAEGDGDNGALG